MLPAPIDLFRPGVKVSRLVSENFRGQITPRGSADNVAWSRSMPLGKRRGAAPYDSCRLLQLDFGSRVDVRDYAGQVAGEQGGRDPREHFAVGIADDRVDMG